jgi:hypothetical protein
MRTQKHIGLTFIVSAGYSSNLFLKCWLSDRHLIRDRGADILFCDRYTAALAQISPPSHWVRRKVPCDKEAIV